MDGQGRLCPKANHLSTGNKKAGNYATNLCSEAGEAEVITSCVRALVLEHRLTVHWNLSGAVAHKQ